MGIPPLSASLALLCLMQSICFAQSPLPDWIKNATLYEVNLRQITPEGNCQSFRRHLSRLKAMGIGAVAFLPLQPISLVGRKGRLGSFYTVADYKLLNSEFGRADDFRALVDEVHASGMRVMIEWVAKHTGRDHEWVNLHPEWYVSVQDSATHMGETLSDRFAKLDFNNKPMRIEMVKSMMHWIEAFHIDGFIGHDAASVPKSFWSQFNKSCMAMKKNVIMLAKEEDPALRNENLFHADYAQSFQQLLSEIYAGTKKAKDLAEYLEEDRKKYNKGFHIYFTSNFEEDERNETEFDKFGDAHRAFATLCFTLKGIPLISTGQEEPITRKLKVYDKDTIYFEKLAYENFYKRLIFLKKNNKALYSDSLSVSEEIIKGSNENLFVFTRTRGNDKVICIYNFSSLAAAYILEDKRITGKYTDLESGKVSLLKKGQTIALPPWGYKIYHQESK